MKVNVAYLGLLLAFALILSYIETLIPFQFGIPGIKLGLTNLAVILCIYLIGYREALLLALTKAIICGLLFGNLTMILYSLSGAFFSCIIMIIMVKSDKFHLPLVSAAGGVMHNMGQLAVAYAVIKTYGILYYIPMLILSGFITGILIGIAASLVKPYISRIMIRGESKL